MGAGVAHVSIERGMDVILKDMAMPGLVRGMQQIEKGLSTGNVQILFGFTVLEDLN